MRGARSLEASQSLFYYLLFCHHFVILLPQNPQKPRKFRFFYWEKLFVDRVEITWYFALVGRLVPTELSII